MIKGIVFDFDGLIIDTETIWFEAFKETMHDLYQAVVTLENYAKCIGTSEDVLYSYLQELVLENFNKMQIRELAHTKYNEKMTEPTLRDGVIDYLKEAKLLGLKIGLASSSSREWVHRYLRKCGIEDFFETIKVKEDVEKVKPDPALYREAVKALNLNPNEVIAFEDSKNGATAALQAGLFCIIVPNSVTNKLLFEGHHARIASMSEKTLPELIKIIEN